MQYKQHTEEYNMADFDLDLEDFSEEGGFSDLREAGVYDVALKHISMVVKPNGVTEWSVTVNAGGKYDDTFYGVAAKFTTGKFSPGMNRIVKPLLKLCGITKPSPEGKLVDTKDGKKEITVYAGIQDNPVKIAVRKEWSTYKGEYESKIFRVFSLDGRTSTEIDKGLTEGVELGKLSLNSVDSDYKGKAPAAGQTATAAAKPEVDMSDDFDID